MTSTPRIRLTTFNTHWGGTESNWNTPGQFIRSLLKLPNRCGSPDDSFEGTVREILHMSDVVCFQEFPIRFDDEIGEYVPDLDTEILGSTHDFFCVRTLNTSTYDQSNVPEPLRGTNQDIGLVTAVDKLFQGELVKEIMPIRQKGDRSDERTFPVIRFRDFVSGREALVVNIYGTSPNLKSGLSSARNNLYETLKIIEYAEYAHGIPTFLAGDFNLPLRKVADMLRQFHSRLRPNYISVGGTFPTMTLDVIPEITGMQLDHIVGLNGADAGDAVSLKGLSTGGDHLAVSAFVSIGARVFAFDPTMKAQRSQLSRRFRPVPPHAG